MVWSRNSFLITIPAEFPGNLRSRNRIQKKLKLPWKLNAIKATFRVCLQSMVSVRANRWWTKSPPANRQPYNVTLVIHGKRRTCLINAFRIIAALVSPNQSSHGVIRCNISLNVSSRWLTLKVKNECHIISVRITNAEYFLPVLDIKRS